MHDTLLMADLLKWKEPRAVSIWEFKHEGIPEIINLFRLFWKWSLILGLPVLSAAWIWLPAGIPAAARGLLVCCIVVPSIPLFQLWLTSRFRTVQCIVDKRGLTRQGLDYAQRYPWKQIEAYEFQDYPNVPDVRMLTIRVHQRRRRQERNFRFSPIEVDERRLAELLRQYSAPISA